MILILSQSEFEISTEQVIDWLLHFNISYVKINSDQRLDILKDFDDYKSVWYRRWDNSKNFKIELNSIKSTSILKNNLLYNQKAKSDFFFHKLRSSYWLSHPKNVYINKLIVLDIAETIGFNIPNYTLVNNKKRLVEFKKNNQRIITKSIANTEMLIDTEYSVLFYTIEITNHHLNKIPSTFPESFIQKFIEKEYEIRAFVLNSNIYSMAIITSGNEIDYRKRDPNDLRKVPYQLPYEVEEKIKVLMNKLNLNTASLDFIYGKDDQLYFLEINPIGQFGMISESCNYYLERKIALDLMNP
ncbi:ATP-grasp domain-containing protein [Aquimarina rhabdastrellae]